MNIFIRTVNTFLLAVILSAATVAVSAGGNSEAEYRFWTSPAAVTGADSVWSMNFRAWQPPRPVAIYPSWARADTAWTDGYAIYYNPQIASQVPAKVWAFTVAHEYGHIYQRTSNENASDIFAARVYAQTDRSVCQAMAWWMINVPNAGDATHLPSPVRARIIARDCGV